MPFTAVLLQVKNRQQIEAHSLNKYLRLNKLVTKRDDNIAKIDPSYIASTAVFLLFAIVKRRP